MCPQGTRAVVLVHLRVMTAEVHIRSGECTKDVTQLTSVPIYSSACIRNTNAACWQMVDTRARFQLDTVRLRDPGPTQARGRESSSQHFFQNLKPRFI